jgi:uncharacterized protein (TIGR03435 family)
MKPNEEKVTKTLNQFLDQLGNPLPEKLEESISARVLQRLQSNANLLSRGVAAAPAESRQGSFGLFALITTAAVVLVLIPMFVIRPLVFPSGSIAVVEGDGGKPVNAGEVIRSNDAAGTVVKLEDGSRIEMRSKSELALERGADGLRIEFHKGGITVKAAKQRAGHLVVQTKDVLISVIGTVFFVEAEESGSRVEVIEGKVQVQQGATLKKLSVGEEFSTLTTGAAPIPVQAPTPIQKAPEEAISFEATSIRPSDPNQGGGRAGGGGRGSLSNKCATRPLQVDPARFTVVNATLYRLILLAYGKNCGAASANDLLRAPDWVATERFDIQTSIPDGVPSYTRDQLDNGNAPELQKMLQTMLADRFKLALHRETREMPIYALTIAKSGPKLKEGGPRPSAIFQGVNPDGHLLHFIDQGEIQRLVNDLSGNPTIHRIVVDKTGLRGEYIFFLGWDSDDDFLDAMQEQWGLKLESAKASVEVLVIDRVEKPSGN